MNKNGPIIVIEDDEDDQFMLSQIFKSLAYRNQVIFFSDGVKAVDYLTTTEIVPFLIFSDVNMPKENGLQVRHKVHAQKDPLKSVPFIFFATVVDTQSIKEAYSLSVQGFFMKPGDYENLYETISIIVAYWKRCYSPISNLDRA